MLNLLRSLLLLCIAISLSTYLLPIAFIYTFIKKFGQIDIFAELIFRVAYSLDQLGNVFCKYLFNDLLIKEKETHPFGHPDETVSSVLGKNYQKNNLTLIGKILNNFLDFLDTNHTVKSIELIQTNKTYIMKTQKTEEQKNKTFFGWLTNKYGRIYLIGTLLGLFLLYQYGVQFNDVVKNEGGKYWGVIILGLIWGGFTIGMIFQALKMYTKRNLK